MLLVLATILVEGCGKNKPTYELMIGNKTIVLPVHQNAAVIQDDLVSNLKPLWDDLDTGESATFQCRRIMPFDLGEDIEKKVKEKYGKRASVTSTQTVITPLIRFFKNRRGTSGLEQLDDGKAPFPMIYGEAVEWGQIEYYLRDQVFSIQKIRWSIQGDVSEQGAAADADKPRR